MSAPWKSYLILEPEKTLEVIMALNKRMQPYVIWPAVLDTTAC